MRGGSWTECGALRQLEGTGLQVQLFLPDAKTTAAAYQPGMLFADDLSLFSTSLADTQRLLDPLHAFCNLFLLEVKVGKTSILVLRTKLHCCTGATL